jgi:DNA-binding CsgD family transcriptional regulator
VTDRTGAIFQHHEYFPNGEVWIDEKSTIFRTPYQFAGEYATRTTGSATSGSAGSSRRAVLLQRRPRAVQRPVFEALRAGASGFLLKDAPAEQLLAAIRVVARGEALLDPALTQSVVSAFVSSTPARPQLRRKLTRLTAREGETLRLLASGLSNAEIAERLVLSEATVKTHVGHVLAKLDVRDRVQAVIFAYEVGLIRP